MGTLFGGNLLDHRQLPRKLQAELASSPHGADCCHIVVGEDGGRWLSARQDLPGNLATGPMGGAPAATACSGPGIAVRLAVS